MPFKTVLSVVGIEPESADLVAAAELCERIGAHLKVVILTCAPPPPVGDIGGLAYIAWSQHWQDDNKKLDERAAEMKQLLAAKGLSLEIQPLFTLRSYADEDIGRQARYADVTIVGADLRKDEFLFNRVLNGAIFQSPAPVILAPKGKAVDLAPKTVLVAWNGGLEAGRAMRQAMDLLAAADNVHVAIIDPEASAITMGEEPGADIATFLARHGVKVTVDILASGGRDFGEVLRQHAVDIDAGMIVMGAYGHSRMREQFFGGMTRSMIEDSGVPVLFAH